MDGLLIALVVAALVIGALLIIFIQLTSRGHQKLDREMYRKVWRAIQHGAKAGGSDGLQMAIVKAMRDCGVAGTTMGDRLKARKGDWTDENGLWAAHKLRNQIAHETNVKLTAQSFRRAMTSFEQALKDLGAL